jgi:hypothetical protein
VSYALRMAIPCAAMGVQGGSKTDAGRPIEGGIPWDGSGPVPGCPPAGRRRVGHGGPLRYFRESMVGDGCTPMYWLQ